MTTLSYHHYETMGDNNLKDMSHTTMSYYHYELQQQGVIIKSPQDNEGKANLETVAPKDVPPSNLLRISEEIIIK